MYKLPFKKHDRLNGDGDDDDEVMMMITIMSEKIKQSD